MTVLQITCDNCGAKYKLPESFTGAQAKCQKCQSIIDVARQRAAAQGGAGEAAKPAAAAKPASAAKPAVDRSKLGRPAEPATKGAAKPAGKTPAKPAGRPVGKGGRLATSRAAAGDDDDDGHPKVMAPKKSSNMPVLLAGLALLVVAGVVVVVKMSGEKPKPEPTKEAKADAGKAAETDKPVDGTPPAAEPDKAIAPGGGPAKPKGDATPADAAAKEAEKPADAPANKPAETPAAAAPAGDEIVLPTGLKIHVLNPPATMDRVTDPKSYPEVTWPASIDEATKAEARKLAEAAATDTGMAGLRASNALESMGHPALFAIAEQMRLVDYKTADGLQAGNALNRTMQSITKGFAGYVQVGFDWEITPQLAEYQTRTVKKWIDTLARFQTAADLKKVVDASRGKSTPDDDK